MKKLHLQIRTYSLLFLFVFITFCNGQVKTNTPEDQTKESPNGRAGLAKIKKIPGISEHANVRCGLQDNRENMWFGTTAQGIYRYDGKSFTHFTVKDGLSSNAVISMLEDKAGTIWIGTDIGSVCRYDGKTFSSFSE